MAIDVKEIDTKLALIALQIKALIREENILKLVREKILHGTEEDRELILIVGKMTIDSINLIIKNIEDNIRKVGM